MTAKKAVNLNVDADLLLEARAEKVKLSAVAERAIRAEIANIRAERWKRENAEALAAQAAYLDANGLPLARLRQF